MALLPSPLRSCLPTLSVALLAALSGCQDDGTSRLFNEEGVWSVTQYDLGNGFSDVNTNNRKDAFLLKFDSSTSVVTTATCGASENVTPANSLCLTDPSSSWFCSCFAYVFEDVTMTWREFEAGEAVPIVQPSSQASAPPEFRGGAVDTGESSGGEAPAETGGETGEGGGDPTDGDSGGSTTTVAVGEVPDVAATYAFRPLPEGIFGSDGATSQYILQQRATSLFDDVTCEPCVP